MSLDSNLKPLQETPLRMCGWLFGNSALAVAEIPAASDLAQSDGVPSLWFQPADCPNEENDIRRAVAGIEGIRSPAFPAVSRTVSTMRRFEALDAAFMPPSAGGSA